MLSPCPTIGRDDGLVGEYSFELTVVRGDVVRSEQRALAINWHCQSIGIIGSAIVEKDIVNTQYPSLARVQFLHSGSGHVPE